MFKTLNFLLKQDKVWGSGVVRERGKREEREDKNLTSVKEIEAKVATRRLETRTEGGT